MQIRHRVLEDMSVTILTAKDAEALWDFYLCGLQTQDRASFNPYPLFSPPVSSLGELRDRITAWQSEDDWLVFVLKIGWEIIGMGILKRYKTGRPVDGVAVRGDFRRMGLGTLLLNIVNTQAGLLGLKRVYASVDSSNVGSMRLHKKCGYKQTGFLVPRYGYNNGRKVVVGQDMEMVCEISRGRKRVWQIWR